MSDHDQDRVIRAALTLLLIAYGALLVWLWDGRGRRER